MADARTDPLHYLREIRANVEKLQAQGQVTPKENALFGLPSQKPCPACTVGKKITHTLSGLFQDAEQALEAQLAQTDLAQVVARITSEPCAEQTQAMG